MSWDQIVNAIREFMNQPVPIICCSVGALLVFVLTIIAKTSIGKKSLNQLKEMYRQMESKHTEIMLSYQSSEVEHINRMSEMKNYYEEKLAIVESEKAKLEELIYFIGENIHNKNIESKIADYKEEASKRINDISQVVNEEVEKSKTKFAVEIKLINEEIKKLYEEIKEYKHHEK